ncbi:MAG: hypothetical protein ACE5PO_03695, partial [Candidatus Bathyarchaeia archaeon]
KPTRVTLAKLRMGYDKMLITGGETIKPRETSPRALKGGIAEVKLDSPVSEFLEKTCIEGFEHHVCVVPEDVKAELVELCRVLDIEPVLI